MKTRISVFETSSPASHRTATIWLMVLVAALALFASGVACRLGDPDRDWPQAKVSPADGSARQENRP